MATKNNDDFVKLIAKFTKLDRKLYISSCKDTYRSEALELSRKLTASLEDPTNRAIDLALKPFDSAAARIAIDLKLFEHICAHDKVSSQELAKITGADELLIRRVLRVLACQDFVSEYGLDEWIATTTTKAMASAPIAAGHRFIFDVLIRSAVKAPRYLAETGFKCPTEPTDGILQYALQTKLDFYNHLKSTPSLFHDFNLFMGEVMGSCEYWHQWYNVQGRLLQDYNESFGPLLVDVGGGKGQDSQAFHIKFIWTGGYEERIVLQDLAPVLNSIAPSMLHKAIETIPQDFFDAQPLTCHGACVYLLHHILHNWSDHYCLKILANLRIAMRPGYSKLLILDAVLPDSGVEELQARFDLTMMIFNGGIERSKLQWKTLFGEAGFTITGIFEQQGTDGIVEAMVIV